MESAQTENFLLDGTSTMANVKISGALVNKDSIYTNEEFLADGNLTNQSNPYADYNAIAAEYSWINGWTRTWGASSEEAENIIPDGTELNASLTENATLGAGNTYYLSGAYTVEEGATLNIQEGVTLIARYDDNVDYILVKQGAKINAIGTAENPIVMTSEQKEAGAWGGIHICGRAHTNAEGGEGMSEIGNAAYGGDDDADNSGTLQYVRLEYTGYAFDEEHEANGISFYGVGNGTTVDHCVAYKGSDDGFEFFGGSVNVSNMVVISCSDDSFDWTEGWNGTATDLVAYQEPVETLGYECDCLIEADNNENNYVAAPVAQPTLSNLILVGNGADGQGVRLRRGTYVKMDNAQICGKGKPLTVESEETENALLAGTDAFITNTTISTNVDSEKNIYTNEAFLADAGNKVDTNLTFADFDAIKAACDWLAGAWIGE